MAYKKLTVIIKYSLKKGGKYDMVYPFGITI